MGSGWDGRSSPPLTHPACTTWRQRNSKTSDCGDCLRGRLHIGQWTLAAEVNDRTISILGVVGEHSVDSQVRKKPLVWSLCNFRARSEQSPLRIAWQPSKREICRWKSCKILMIASFRPGISRPFLMRRIRRIGSISAPTFSSRPRINATQV